MIKFVFVLLLASVSVVAQENVSRVSHASCEWFVPICAYITPLYSPSGLMCQLPPAALDFRSVHFFHEDDSAFAKHRFNNANTIKRAGDYEIVGMYSRIGDNYFVRVDDSKSKDSVMFFGFTNNVVLGYVNSCIEQSMGAD